MILGELGALTTTLPDMNLYYTCFNVPWPLRLFLVCLLLLLVRSLRALRLQLVRLGFLQLIMVYCSVQGLFQCFFKTKACLLMLVCTVVGKSLFSGSYNEFSKLMPTCSCSFSDLVLKMLFQN